MTTVQKEKFILLIYVGDKHSSLLSDFVNLTFFYFVRMKP